MNEIIYPEEVIFVDMEQINNFGKYADLDECCKCYVHGTCPIHWGDYENDDENHSQFFSAFEKWWDSLSYQEKKYNYKTRLLPL